jgi:hypothetical protein
MTNSGTTTEVAPVQAGTERGFTFLPSGKVVKPGYTKILGYWVKLGTKRHSILVETKKHLDDLRREETNSRSS